MRPERRFQVSSGIALEPPDVRRARDIWENRGGRISSSANDDRHITSKTTLWDSPWFPRLAPCGFDDLAKSWQYLPMSRRLDEITQTQVTDPNSDLKLGKEKENRKFPKPKRLKGGRGVGFCHRRGSFRYILPMASCMSCGKPVCRQNLIVSQTQRLAQTRLTLDGVA